MTMITIGIDPGLAGAFAALDPHGNIVSLHDLPVITEKSLKWIDGDELQSYIICALRGGKGRAIVERVSAMPKQGIASAFNFGVGFGSVLSVLQAARVPIEFVSAGAWKKALGLSADKKQSLHKARLMFPEADLRLAKHDGRAEALLIAHWYLSRKQAAA